MSRHLILASLVVIGSVLRIFATASVVVVPDEATVVEKFAASELAGELVVATTLASIFSIFFWIVAASSLGIM